MTKIPQLSSPRSTGAEGVKFELHVASSFVTLMLAGGFAPCLPPFPITKVMLQAKWAGYDVDDFVVFTTDPRSNQLRRLSCQIKETINIGDNEEFRKVIAAAWSDFNKPEKFEIGVDAIALIKGPLSSDDSRHTREILEWARSGSDCTGFMNKVELHNSSSKQKRASLIYFRKALTAAKGSEISDQELFDFMRHFHFLGYDLDIRAGVTLSLLQSLISAYSPNEAHSIWTQIVYEVQGLSTVAGEITRDSLPEEIRNAFVQRSVQAIPHELSLSLEQEYKKSWLEFKHPDALTVVNLVGGWIDANDEDQRLVSTLSGKSLLTWNEEVRTILLEPNSPLQLTNARWHLTDRQKLWEDMGPRVFDDHLKKFTELAIEVLGELNPRYELDPDHRMMAGLLGKKMKYSQVLRQNVAETLVLLAMKQETLTNVSIFEATHVPVIVVRKILKDADWQLWASLGQLLPVLAEAAPEQFLDALEEALRSDPGPFDELFAEVEGLFRDNNMSKVLWALETLAWDDALLIRVCLILAWLDNIDPGGNTSNRPMNSLTSILLPWYPQTLASVERRKLAFESIREELPDVAWKLANEFLPNKISYSTGSVKPKWRTPVPDGWKPVVQNSEFVEQMHYYSDAAVEMAKGGIERIVSLSKRLENFSPETLINFIEQISVDELAQASEANRTTLWRGLSTFKDDISEYDGIDPKVKKRAITQLGKIIKAIRPLSPSLIHKRLFSNNHFPRERKKETWEERDDRLNKSRVDAVKSIIDSSGVEDVFSFASSIDEPFAVGRALAEMRDDTLDDVLLPRFLNSDNSKELQMVEGFVKFRFRTADWEWIERLNVKEWSAEEKARLLSSAHFVKGTWQKVEELLGTDEDKYWSTVLSYGFMEKDHMLYAVDKLMLYGRPSAALKCIYQWRHNESEIDIDRSLLALREAVNSEEPKYSQASQYEIAKIIKKLQTSTLSDEQYAQLAIVEWIYLPLLGKHRDAKPESLHQQLGADPDFFMQIISMIYRSENTDPESVVVTEEKSKLAAHAYKLLNEWRTVPGTQRDGIFSETAFDSWLTAVKKRCENEGYWAVASSHIGKVLYYSPADPDGLWINKAVAKQLNHLRHDRMRSGFSTGAYNSRGLHSVDPTGKQEEAIGDKFRQKRDELEQAKFPRFAATLKSLAESYYRDAERTRDDHKNEES